MESEERGLIPQEEGPLGRIVITEAQLDLIKNTVAMGATDDELKLFMFECRRRGVHPMDRLIHFVKRKGKEGEPDRATFQAGIDFMRSQAESTGEYRGQEDVEYGPMIDCKYFENSLKVPEWAKATVKRRDTGTGELISTSATAHWSEFYPGDKMGFMWRKMPRVMLGKTAESQALRKAFPRQLAGLYSFEEMEQADIIQAPEREPIATPKAKEQTQETPSPGAAPVISEAQAKRFYAIAKKTGASDEAIKMWLSQQYGWTSTKQITKELYEEVCERVVVEVMAREPGSEG